jgi:hypothetical protein
MLTGQMKATLNTGVGGGNFHRVKIMCRIYHYVKATLAGTLVFKGYFKWYSRLELN